MKRTHNKSSKDRKSGQAIIFLIMVLFIGTIVVIWNFDLHNIVSAKIRINNAGDAAALSAARWQGITLNMIGELNLVQAAYMCEEISQMDPTGSDFTNDLETLILDVEENIVPLRRRLALCGPLMGMVAAQSSSLLNLTESDQEKIVETTASYMAERGEEFENSGSYYMGVVEEPYDGAWAEYGGLLSSIAENDVVVDCLNADFFIFYSSMSHFLLREGFYDAVRGGRPCYFYSGSANALLTSYTDYSSWDSLPPLSDREAVNSEYFGTDVYEYEQQYSLQRVYNATNGHVNYYTNYYTESELTSADLDEDMLEYLQETSPTDSLDDLEFSYYWMKQLYCTWHYFPRGIWFNTTSYESGKYFPDSEDFPFEDGWKFKDWYNYGGAEAVVQASIETDVYTPGMQIVEDDIIWNAAAKPFGYLEDPDGDADPVAPVYYAMVLPAFHDVRLIHTGLAQGGGSSAGSSEWLEHIYEHVPEYLEGGHTAIEDNNCDYCEALIKWDTTDFRDQVLEWLEENPDGCTTDDNNNTYSGTPMGRG